MPKNPFNTDAGINPPNSGSLPKGFPLSKASIMIVSSAEVPNISTTHRPSRRIISPEVTRFIFPFANTGSGMDTNHVNHVDRFTSAPLGWLPSAAAAHLKNPWKPNVEARNQRSEADESGSKVDADGAAPCEEEG